MLHFLLWLGLAAAPQARDSTWQQYDAAAEAARAAGDYQAYGRALHHLYDLLSGHPTITYQLAVAAARTGQPDTAIMWLRAFAGMGLKREIAKDSNLASLHGRADFDSVVAQIARNGQPIARSAQRAFALTDAELLSEDIAYDARSRTFFISSVHRGTIVSTTSTGVATTIARVPAGWGVFALAIDSVHRLLWASAFTIRNTLGYRSADSGRSAMLVYDLNTNRLVRRIDVPADGHPHGLGDMTLDRAGNAYVSDGTDGGVYRVAAGGTTRELLTTGGTFISPQTPALSPDEKRLFVPDYERGIGVIDLETRAVSWLPRPATVAVNGIDGMYRVGHTLIAVQNGTNPERLVALVLDDTMSRIESAEILDANQPGFGDPTHGVVSGDAFYYITNSGWDRYNDDGSCAPKTSPTPPVIMKLPLAKATGRN